MKKSKADHALAAVKAGLSAIPVVGGAIASLIGDYVPTSTQRSIEAALEMLRARIAELADRIDVEAVDKDEFAELFKSCYLTMVRTHQKSKLRAAANLICNILLKPGDAEKLSYRELDHFARCLDTLSIGAVEVLGHLYSLAESKGSVDPTKEYPFRYEDLQKRMPGTDRSLLVGLLAEVGATNLVHLTEGSMLTEREYPEFGLAVMELTPLGIRFVQRLLQSKTVGVQGP